MRLEEKETRSLARMACDIGMCLGEHHTRNHACPLFSRNTDGITPCEVYAVRHEREIRPVLLDYLRREAPRV